MTSMAHSMENISFSAMGYTQSKRVYRGAVTWPHPTALLGISLELYNKIFLRGPSVHFSLNERKHPFQFKVGLRYSTDDKPMISLSNHKEDFRNKRGDSFNIYSSVKYGLGFRNLFYLGAKVIRDLSRYHTSHFVLSAGAPVFPFTSLKIEYGIGSKASNQYAYGTEAVSGEGHFGLGLKIVLVRLPWSGIAFFDFDNTWILQNENRYADYVRGDFKNSKISTRLIWKFK